MASEADIAHWKDAEKRVAELQKENARLREALEEIFLWAVDERNIRVIRKSAEVALSPTGGAVQKGLSKEKTK